MYICHSFHKKERYSEAVACYMENWGLSVPQICLEENYFLENDYVQLKCGIQNEKSVLIILTPYLITDVGALVELDIIKNLFMEKKVKVFTFCYDLELSNIPKRMEWLKKTEFMLIDGVSSLYQGICGIIDFHLEEHIERIGGISKCRNKAEKLLGEDRYISKMLEEYEKLEKYAVRTKIALLYAIYLYICVKYKKNNKNSFYDNCITQVFEEIDYQEECGILQLRIVERSLLLMAC